MVATDPPSICSWKARFQPKFGTLFTTTRPGGGLACATVLIEIAHTKARIRRALLPKLRLDVIGDITHKTRFSPARMWTNRRKTYIESLPSRDGLLALGANCIGSNTELLFLGEPASASRLIVTLRTRASVRRLAH